VDFADFDIYPGSFWLAACLFTSRLDQSFMSLQMTAVIL